MPLKHFEGILKVIGIIMKRLYTLTTLCLLVLSTHLMGEDSLLDDFAKPVIETLRKRFNLEQFSTFSLEKTSPFAWKDDLLVPFSDVLYIIPKNHWYRKASYFTPLNQTTKKSLNAIRTFFLEQKQRLQEQLNTISDSEKKAHLCMQANKNIQCLNEKLLRFNVKMHQKDSIEPIPLFKHIPITTKKTILLQKASKQRLEQLNAPEGDHPPNIDAFNAWIAAQHPSLQPIARATAKTIINNYIDFPTFIAGLDKCIQEIEQQIGHKPFGIIYWGRDRGSSGCWVRSLIELTKKPAIELSIKQVKTRVEYFRGTNASNVLDWVLVDDAAYSGKQLTMAILPRVTTLLKKRYPDKLVRLHIAIPFMSHLAMKQAQGFQRRNQLRIITKPAYILPSLSSVVQNLSQEDRQLGNSLIPNHTQREQCLAYLWCDGIYWYTFQDMIYIVNVMVIGLRLVSIITLESIPWMLGK